MNAVVIHTPSNNFLGMVLSFRLKDATGYEFVPEFIVYTFEEGN